MDFILLESFAHITEISAVLFGFAYFLNRRYQNRRKMLDARLVITRSGNRAF